MKNSIPPVRSANDKYKLSEMRNGEHKDFGLKLYGTIRLSAYYYSKKLGCRFSTRKMENEEGKTIVRVFRTKK